MRLLTIVVLAACSRDAEPLPAPIVAPVVAPVAASVSPPAQLTHVTIKALGMYCEESCPMRVRYALAAIPTIYELGFDLTKESIFVSFDTSLGPAKDVTKPMLVAIKQAGFDPWLAKEAWPAEATADRVKR